MPRTRTLEVGGEEVVREATMASGKLVRDVIGWRQILSASWEWLPVEVLAAVTALTRTCAFVEIIFPDPVQGVSRGMFRIDIGNAKVFKFSDGEPRWYNVNLQATAQEVA